MEPPTHHNADLTRTLARYAASTRFDRLPDLVQHEAVRAFVNWLGVAIGGSHEDAVIAATAFVADAGGHRQATVIGQGLRSSLADAAFVNCISSSVLAFDDAHLSSVAHPSGPAASALLALAQTRHVSGEDFVSALALGIEIQCRVADMLVLPPSRLHPAIYVNGYSGPIGVAAALGRLLAFDERQLAMAMGLAASQAAGFRATHGTMTAHFRPGHASRTGVVAALLVARGFDCTDDALEARGGFLDVYAGGADPSRAMAELGRRHDMLTNRYKPYPCGIVIHPTIDACLDVRSRLPAGRRIDRVTLTVHPLAITLTGKRAPATPLESHVSLVHWAAAALLRGTAGIAETRPDCLFDEEITTLRGQIEVCGDAAIAKDEAKAEVTLAGGGAIASHVTHARGSLSRPMLDAELSAKFRALVDPHVPIEAAEELERACWDLAALHDVGATVGALLP